MDAERVDGPTPHAPSLTPETMVPRTETMVPRTPVRVESGLVRDALGWIETGVSAFLYARKFDNRAAMIRALYWMLVRRYRTELCQHCGGPVGVVYHAPDWIWEAVTGKGRSPGGEAASGILCPRCLSRLANQAGLPYLRRLDDLRYRNRYGLDVPRNHPTTVALIFAGLAECARVTDKWLLVKCCDYVTSRRLYLGHVEVVKEAERIGLRAHDLIVHAAGAGPGDRQIREVRRSRRAHSYLLVFKRSVR